MKKINSTIVISSLALSMLFSVFLNFQPLPLIFCIALIAVFVFEKMFAEEN